MIAAISAEFFLEAKLDASKIIKGGDCDIGEAALGHS